MHLPRAAGRSEPGNLESVAGGSDSSSPDKCPVTCKILPGNLALAKSDHERRSMSDEQLNGNDEARDIADVPAVELINTVAVHLLSAAAVKVGLADSPETQTDLDEARKLINALAGLITAAAPEVSSSHAAPLRDGLRSVQLAFREASHHPDAPGKGPGEKYTGSVI